MEFIKTFHTQLDSWCRGRQWIIRLLFLLFLIYVFINHLSSDTYKSIFGYLNLGVHELGHYVFIFFGHFIEVFGGSLLQCLAPVIAMIMFWRTRDYFAVSFCFGWLSTNFFEVATYAGDARAMALELVRPGGGIIIHDWNYLLGELGMLDYDSTLAFFLRCAAVLSMLIFLTLGGYIIYLMFKYRKEPSPAEDI